MPQIWIRLLPYIAAVLLVAAALFGVYHHGVSVTNATWQAQWNARDTRDGLAKAENEASARAQEQAYQQSINKAVQDGQRLIDQATTDAVAARNSADSLRGAADSLTARLAASQASGNSCTAAASKAATSAAMVLADVLKRADQRAGDLAEVADQARARGVTCEQAYDGLGK
jgi:bifunctional ADP-heptose synthase (sugar kinase/adenylyltransferase)